MTEKLSSKVIKGSFWVLSGSILGRGIDFGFQIALSRLLMPEEFGLMAIGLSFVAIIETLTETGFGSAIIQKQGDVKKYLNTAWTLEISKSILLLLVVYLCANSIAVFYNDIRIGPLLKVLSTIFILRGFRNIGIIFFRKDFLLKKLFFFELIPTIIQIIIVVPIAIFFRNYWVLVAGVLVKRVSEFFLSYILHSYRPKVNFNIDNVKTLVRFGKWIFFIGLISGLRKNGISLFIGKYFGLDILGFFNRAELFSTLLFVLLGEIVWKVGYPAFSILQRNKEKMWYEYNNLVQAIAFFCFPIMGIIFVFSSDIVNLLLSAKWSDSGPIASLLGMVGILGLINAPALIIFQSIGKPSKATILTLISFTILVIIIIPFSILFNITGLIISLIISGVVVNLISWFMIYKLFNNPFGELLKSIFLSLLNTIISSIFIYILIITYFPYLNILKLFMLVIIYAIVYLFIALIFELFFNYGFIKILRNKYKVLITL
jgi:lipopolysaccharide exporter